MKKVFVLLVLMLSFTGCGSTGAVTNQGTEVASEAQVESAVVESESPVESTAPSNEDGTLGVYKVEFGTGEKVQSTYGNGDLLAVTYTFTNNSDEAVASDTAIMLTAYQDGVEIEQIFETELTGENASKSIKPGVSIECKALFKLTSTSEVEVEASEFLGMDGSKVIKTYTVQ